MTSCSSCRSTRLRRRCLASESAARMATGVWAMSTISRLRPYDRVVALAQSTSPNGPRSAIGYGHSHPAGSDRRLARYSGRRPTRAATTCTSSLADVYRVLYRDGFILPWSDGIRSRTRACHATPPGTCIRADRASLLLALACTRCRPTRACSRRSETLARLKLFVMR